MTTHLIGLEPMTCGLEDRRSKNATIDKSKSCEPSEEQLTHQLTQKSSKQPQTGIQELPSDLIEIIQLWPSLPEHIKAAIKALVKTRDA